MTRTTRTPATTQDAHDTLTGAHAMTITIDAAELRRLILAVEKSAARDDSRPVLAGIQATINGDRLTLAAADGFRLSTAYATLDAAPAHDASAILERAGLVAFGKSIKPKLAPRATVRLIDGTYPDFQSIIGTGDEPVLFAVNPHYFRDTLNSHGENVVKVSRATDDAHAPLFFTADDGTRHVVMPMVISNPSADWKRREDASTRAERDAAEDAAFAAKVAAAEVAPVAADVEPEPAPVTPAESAYRTRDAANERRLTKRAERRAASAPRCATCDALGEAPDNFCGLCGSPFGEVAPVATRPTPIRPELVTRPATIAAYSEANQRRILDACPHATEVRTFNGWLTAGRVVMKGQHGIRLVAPETVDDSGKVRSIKPVFVFDLTQTQELARHAAA